MHFQQALLVQFKAQATLLLTVLHEVVEVAVNRVSTSLVSYLGAEVSARNTRGGLRNTIKSGQGNEILAPADPGRASNKNLVNASVKIADFDAAKGYFESRGAAPLAAKAMALVLVDVAKAQGVSTMSLLDGSDKQKIKLIEAEAYNYINQLRETTTQLSGSKPTNNKSVRARYLLA
jgi:hypothetical protein